MRNKKLIVLVAILIAGLVLSLFAFDITLMAGHNWLTERSNESWHMNNYIVIPGIVAFLGFGLLPMFFGGAFTGFALPLFFVRWRKRAVVVGGVIAFFGAIILTGLGFNTLDWMLGSMYWAGDNPANPINFNLFSSSVTIEAWNAYFFVVLAPLWISGFLIGISSSIMLLVASFIRRFKR